MRYMGDPSAIGFFGANDRKLDPIAKANFVALAKSMPDERAEDLADINDATPYGSRLRLVRMGIGAGVGLILGVVVGRAMKRR